MNGDHNINNNAGSNHNTYLAKENGHPVDNNNKQYSISCSTPGGITTTTTTGTSNQFSISNVSQVQNIKIESAAEIQAAAKRRTQSCSAIQGAVNKEPQSPVSKVKL